MKIPGVEERRKKEEEDVVASSVFNPSRRRRRGPRAVRGNDGNPLEFSLGRKIPQLNHRTLYSLAIKQISRISGVNLVGPVQKSPAY